MMKVIDANKFKEMISSACANLERYENEINTLNVFPVPDGDTGTNMYMTFKNGLSEANNVISNNIGDVIKGLSRGLLMGARGNSGVITSQIFRGIYKYCQDKETLDVDDLSKAFLEGAKVAYKAIMKPVEGTILTVIREGSYNAAKKIEVSSNTDVLEYFNILTDCVKEALDNTPNLLPALKEANVVDSGGMGLYRIIEGFKLYLDGNPVINKNDGIVELSKDVQDIKEYIGYLCNFKLQLNHEYAKKFDIEIIRKRLNAVGENVELNYEDGTLNVSINTMHPGEVLTVAQRYGEFKTLNLDNNLLKEEVKQTKKFGLISVCTGDGLIKIFKELGTDTIINGGQTMNPSTKDFLDEIEKLDNCETIFIFPNNSNIILAATQASKLTRSDVVVIPSKTIQAGLSAITMFDHNATKQENEETMLDIVNNIKTAMITYAVKDTCFEGVEVKQNDFISLVDKTILASSKDLKEVLFKSIDKLTENSDGELLTIITGEGSNETLTDELVKYVEDNTKFEVQIIEGGQKVYSYLLGLE